MSDPSLARPGDAPSTRPSAFRTFARRRPVTTFLVLTVLVSWPLGLLAVGPSLAALACAALIGGRSEVRALLSSLLRWRVGTRWYAVALVGPVVLVCVAVALSMLVGADFVLANPLTGSAGFGALLALQLLLPLSGPWEELGWRGYLLPLFLDRWSPLLASLVLGIIWAVWHLPVFVTGTVPWADAAFIIPVSVLFTVVYLHTRRSVLIAFLMHGSLNAAAAVALPMFGEADKVTFYWMLALVAAVVAVGAVIGDRRMGITPDRRLSRWPRPGAAGPVATG